MVFTQSPVIFIAAIMGLALFVILVWFGFYLIRHRPYIAKPVDTEQALDYYSGGGHALPDYNQQQHPPVYCVDDVACPPPSYQAVFTRQAAPTPHELRVLHRRLEKLQRRRRRSSNSGSADAGSCETAIRDSEIRCLAQWIERLETLRDEEEEQYADPVLGRRRTVRLVQSESEPAMHPTRWATVREYSATQGSTLERSATEPGLVCFARSREVAPPPTPMAAPATSPTPAEMDLRFAELREQLMRVLPSR